MEEITEEILASKKKGAMRKGRKREKKGEKGRKREKKGEKGKDGIGFKKKGEEKEKSGRE